MKPLLNTGLFLNFHNVFHNEINFPQSFALCTNQVYTIFTYVVVRKFFPQKSHNFFHNGKPVNPYRITPKFLVFRNFHSLYYYY